MARVVDPDRWQPITFTRADGSKFTQDMKLFFSLGAVGLDTFIAAWEAKRFYDSSRPWTLIHETLAGSAIEGWGGPGLGTVSLAEENWLPYSPEDFVTPPFPGYVSGHSTVSCASARLMELFTGSDYFGFETTWQVGSLTEPTATCAEISGKPSATATDCAVVIRLPTFTATAERATLASWADFTFSRTTSLAW